MQDDDDDNGTNETRTIATKLKLQLSTIGADLWKIKELINNN